MRGSDSPRQFRCIHPGIRLTETVQRLGERPEHGRRAFRRYRGVILAIPRPVAVDAVQLHLPFQLGDRRPCEAHVAMSPVKFVETG